MGFYPDYKNVENAARNLPSGRMPLYEHLIAASFMERVTGEKFAHLHQGSYEDKLRFFQHYNCLLAGYGLRHRVVPNAA